MQINEIFKSISKFDFYSTSNKNSKMEWNNINKGITNICSKTNSVILFEDIFFNKYKTIDYKKWIFNKNLEFWHFRLGIYSRIFVFDISNLNNITLISNHRCKNDLYDAKLSIINNVIEFEIIITSLIKNEHIVYRYY